MPQIYYEIDPPPSTPTVVATTSESKARVLLISSNDGARWRGLLHYYEETKRSAGSACHVDLLSHASVQGNNSRADIDNVRTRLSGASS